MERKRVLIIDDEKGFATMLGLNLEATAKYEIYIESNAANALETALRFKPDVILLDIIMPEKEGPQVAMEIKGHDDLYKVPIIFLTATVTKEEVDSHNGQIGGHTFIAKPGNLNDLIASIDHKTIF